MIQPVHTYIGFSGFYGTKFSKNRNFFRKPQISGLLEGYGVAGLQRPVSLRTCCFGRNFAEFGIILGWLPDKRNPNTA